MHFKFGIITLTKLTKEPIINVAKLVEIYLAVDEFLKKFMPYMESHLLTNSRRKPTRTGSLNLSEIMTILIGFHVIGFRNFKSYYIHLQQFHSNDFGHLVSYNRFKVKPAPGSFLDVNYIS